jgi:subtilisin family serine protease
VTAIAAPPMGWTEGGRRRRLAIGILTATVLLSILPVSSAARREPMIGVIVRAVPGQAQNVARSIQRTGGAIGRKLGLIEGFEARVPASEVARIGSQRAVVSVTPNARVHMLGFQQSLQYDPDAEYGSLFHVTRIVKAPNFWGAHYYGQGVDVALIDTGVVPVEGLTVPGKVINGPDLSFDSQNPDLRYLDGYGHGTNMAGIIAGRDSTAKPNYGDKSKFVGVAPEARIINVKVAAGDGSADVSQVIAAIDWVVQHRNENGMNIRVINLSFGTASTQDYRLDPLAYAAEVAWRKGIVVVAAVGNDGSGTQRLNDPAMDPFVIGVAATDPVGNEDVSNDVVTSFSNSGNGTRNPDVAVPGKSVISLRSPGSKLDKAYPNAVIGTRFFRGSGTSQATAVVSGLVALMLSQRPDLTPDQVKYLLTQNAKAFSSATPVRRGAGTPLSDQIRGDATPAQTAAAQGYAYGTGTGSLEQARGGEHVSDHGTDLVGEQDIFGHAWDGSTWSGSTWAGSTWSGGDWNGSTWAGSTWSGSTWAGSAWAGSTWSGSTWAGSTWSGSTWSSGYWDGSTWSGSTWSGDGWTGSTWSGSSWSSDVWGD